MEDVPLSTLSSGVWFCKAVDAIAYTDGLRVSPLPEIYRVGADGRYYVDKSTKPADLHPEMMVRLMRGIKPKRRRAGDL